MGSLQIVKASAGAFVFATTIVATALAGPFYQPGATVFDSKGVILGIIDSCPSGNFGCIMRRPSPNGVWIRLGASQQGLFSVYDIVLTGLYYQSGNCSGNLYLKALNALVPEAAILNLTNSGTTYTGDLVYPSGAYNTAFSYGSYKTGSVCVNSSGTGSGFTALTTKITFTAPLSVK